MPRLPIRLFLFFSLCLSGLLPAQKDFHFENFSTANGLSHNTIRALLRDRRGFLWVGTSSGLNRFDGYRFEVFLPGRDTRNTIGGEAISALAEDSKGRIWITHNQGLSIYDPLRDSFQQVPVPLPDKGGNWTFPFTSGIVIDNEDRVLVAAPPFDQVLVIDSKTGIQRWFTPPPVAPQWRPLNHRQSERFRVGGATRKSATEAWINTDYGIFRFEIASGRFHHQQLEGIEWALEPTQVYQDNLRQKAWFSIFGQYYVSFDPRSGRWKAWKNITPSHYIVGGLDIAPMGRDYLWFGRPGVLHLPSGKFTLVEHIPDDPYSFPSGAVTVLYTDPDGILWIGASSGLSKLDPHLQSFRHVLLDAHPVYEYDNSVFEIYEEPSDKRLYITSFYTGGVYRYDPSTKRSEKLHSGPKGPTTRILRDSRDSTWLLGHSELYRVDLPRGRFEALAMPALPPGIPDRILADIEEDAHGDLWIAKWRAGVMKYERKTGRLRFLNTQLDGIAPKLAFFLAATPDRKTIWIGTNGEGIYRYEIGSGKSRHFLSVKVDSIDFPIPRVTGIVVDSDGYLWASTHEGLVRLAPDGQARLFRQEDGLASSSIEGLQIDQKGRLWLATSRGISSVDSRTLATRNYDERHGLKLDAILDHFSVSPGGEIFSGTKRGFIRFHPDSIVVDRRAPQVVLTSFKVGGRDYQPDGISADFASRINLKPTENFFSITFSALNFTRPEENTYFYQLEGLDPLWISAGSNRMANYTSVPPGVYRFRVKAQNKDGIWGPEKTVAIRVAPPFWKTPWFVGLVALLISGIIYGAYRLRINQIRREERIKTEFSKKLAAVEMAALRSQMNPHFLFNCLNSINRFIQCNEPDTASTYLTKFSRLIRLVLDHSRANMVSLREELEALRLYLELESMRFVNRFHYEIQLSPLLDINSIEVPPMLIQPYIENAIWHGLMQKLSNDGRLMIRLFPKDQHLIVEVEDNGIGRLAARELKSKSATLHKSHGMKVTAERIEIINQIYQTRAQVEIQDLFDPQGAAAGTKVILSLPLD